MSNAALPLFPPERWREVRAALERIEALREEDRPRALEAIAAADKELADTVRALLDEKPVEAPLRAIETLLPPLPGRIGAFHPLSLLGTGGMGRVYLAERRGIDFTQRVALKLLDATGPNVSHLIARERGILAALTHPNITAFVDAGTDDGKAWLAMEYVDGESLLAYSDRLQLDTAARARLFDQVCAAVAYAHSQLVVHRDLKPPNVLINREGVVKLLDFGIAAMVTADQGAQPATRVFTPEYAAPEQLRGERATTASDVYALGLMLYELIVGRRLPTLTREGGSADWTTAELVHFAITSTHASETTTRADKTIRQQLRGDLGRIISHALAFEPGQRYVAVLQLRDDLSRWLDHRPLNIGRRKFSYVAARFARRHRVAISLAATAVLALIGTSVFALWQAQRARVAEVDAKHKAQDLEQVVKFQESQLSGIDPALMGKRLRQAELDAVPQDKRGALDTALAGVNFTDLALKSLDENIFDRALSVIHEQFAKQPLQQAYLLATIASTMKKLGLLAQAAAPQAEALAIRRRELGNLHPDTLESINDYAHFLDQQGQLPEAERYYREALDGFRKVLGDANPDTLVVMSNLGSLLSQEGKSEEAERVQREVVTRDRQVLGNDSDKTLNAILNLGYLLSSQSRYAEAEPYLREAFDGYRRVLGSEHAETLAAMSNLGGCLNFEGKFDDAQAILRELLGTSRRVLGDKHRVTLSALNNLGFVERKLGHFDKAAALESEGIESARQVFPEGHSWIGRVTLEYAQTLAALHRFSEAEKNALEGQAILAKSLAPTHRFNVEAVQFLTEFYAHWDAAEPGKGYAAKAAQWRAAIASPK